MRSNGLTAEDYTPVAEGVDRYVAADALLALRDEGVAAYLVLPHEGGGQATILADRDAFQRARDVVRTLAPNSLVPSDDEAWREIVAGYRETADEPTPQIERRDPAGSQTAAHESADHEAPAGRSHDEDEDHFVPPPPPAAPRVDPLTRLAWMGVLGGPLTLFVATLLTWSPPRLVVLAAVVAFVAGLVGLIVRMDERPPPDSGPDDGAVI